VVKEVFTERRESERPGSALPVSIERKPVNLPIPVYPFAPDRDSSCEDDPPPPMTDSELQFDTAQDRIECSRIDIGTLSR